MSIKEKKLGKVTSEGKDVTDGNKPQNQCMNCCVNVPAGKVVSCEKCLGGKYCSVKVQKKAHKSH